ncbi:hypothetical protein HPB47_023633, partial [Ixodes persulcatus]
MKDLPGKFKTIPGVDDVIYSDDITIWCKYGSDGQVEERHEAAASITAEYARNRGLRCWTEKSELLVMRNPREGLVTHISVKMDGREVSKPALGHDDPGVVPQRDSGIDSPGQPAYAALAWERRSAGLDMDSDSSGMKAPIKDGVISSLFPACEIPCCSFYDLAKEQLQLFPDNVVLADSTVSLTGPQVLARMQRYAAGFQANGVLVGHRVCVHLKNTVENFLAMFGCILAGATVILAKISLTERELHYQMSDGDATHVVTDSEFASKFLNAAKILQLK